MRERRVRRGRPPPAYRIENEYDPEATPQYFQISVHVIEARKLMWSNPQMATSYVMVGLDKKRHRTTVRKNMEEPIYREYLVFEMYMSIREIQRSSLWLAVMETRCCSSPKVLGEATIDLGAVWAQPNHQVYHKWAQLKLPREPQTAGPVGFLKVDISIIFRGEVQVMPTMISNEKVEDVVVGDLLLSSNAEQQRANYLVTVHAAYSLPEFIPQQNGKRLGKPPSTYVRVSFCGLVGKTAVRHRTYDPTYNERISIVEMFPNMNQVIRFEVLSADGYNRIIAGVDLKLSQISHDGDNGFLPTFGPSLLHMYGTPSSSCTVIEEEGPHHKGALLVSLKTIVPYYQQALRSVSVETVAPICVDKLWLEEDFCIFCSIFEISMLDRRVSGKMTGLAVTIGEIPSGGRIDEEFFNTMTELKSRKMHYTGALEVIRTKPYGCIEFPHQFPTLQFATRLPDFRFRMYRNNMVHGVVVDLEKALADVEKRLIHFDYTSPNELVDDVNKALDDTAGNILKLLDIMQYSSNTHSTEDLVQHYSTELDQKQLALQKEEIEKIYNQMLRRTKGESILNLYQVSSRIGVSDSLVSTRKGVKVLLAKTKCLAERLRKTVFKTTDGWPEITIWLLNEGSRVAYSKILPSQVIYSVISEQCGSRCGKLQTIYLRPLKCPRHLSSSPSACVCIAGKVEVLLWMGLYRQRQVFDSFMPSGYVLKCKELVMHVKSSLMMVECRAFIYRAKLTTNADQSLNNSYNAFVRINALSAVKDTKVLSKTSTPLWNQVLKVQKMMHTSQERLNACPPFVLVELLDDNVVGKPELIGRFQIQPVVDNRVGYAPRLQWYDIYKGAQNTGQILMSIQLLQVPERLLKTTYYAPIEDTFFAAEEHGDIENELEVVEHLPNNLIPHSKSYKVDVYWWGLRDVNITRKPYVVLEIDDLVLKSDIISDKKANSNFLNGRLSQVFESPLNEDYSPTLIVRLYDSSTFGRALFLGTNIVKNPSKYIVDWIPKEEREASLKTISIVSSDFNEVSGQMLYVKKSNNTEDYEECMSSTLTKQNISQPVTKRSVWRRMFSRQGPTEEEMTLLPVYAKENNQIKVVKKIPKPKECDDWWMRFFQSENNFYDEDKASDLLTIYDYELEYQPEFSKFKDWCNTLKLYNGKKCGIPEKDEQIQCGYLKAGIAIYRWPPPEHTVAVSLNGVDLQKGYFDEHPNNDPSKYLVRVYVVRAINLPKDLSGKSDPYVLMNCGKKQFGDRENFISYTTEPVFGKMFEFSCTLPEDYLLNISVYDYDTMQPDELIGSTTIDLEDRIYSKHRARVGLAPVYCLSGTAKWRDSSKPSTILEELCERNHIPPPVYPDSFSVIVNGVEYKDYVKGRFTERNYMTAVERKENLCLSILHKWHTLPICGYHLVPEHVETRNLYHPDKPGIERGRIQLWVDIFPIDYGSFIPSPCDITPRKVEEYELRVIVWDVQTMLYGTDKKKSWKTADLYVKTWIGSIEKAQQTDVHYNTISGEGNFNWRMVFNFLYHHAERKIINKEKCPFTEFEEYVAPLLEVQLVESNEGMFLGSLSLNLNMMYCGAKLAQQCTISEMESGRKINLFSLRSIRAWWPLKIMKMSGDDMLVGVIDLEMTLLPREKAVLMPCGIGRDPPCPLPEPNRPDPEEGKYVRWCTYIREMVTSHAKDILIFFVIISVVWFISYLLYLAVPSAEDFIFENKKKRSRNKKVEGIIRTLIPLRW